MTENRNHKHKPENLKTEASFSSRLGEVELGKLVRLPYIRKISTNAYNHSLERKSLENKEHRINRNSNKELNLTEHSQINILTMEELGLCRDNSKEKEGLPKIHYHHNPILNRDKSIESLEHTQINKPHKCHTKTETNDKIKDFKLGPIIGKGTYSVVRAAKTKNNKKVAIKTYLKSSLSNEDRRKNIEHQINVLSLLEHPSILTFIESVETEESISIVTELLDNHSLSDYLKSECFKTVSEDIAKFMIKHLTKAIAYCHSKDIVHRDIKLENILVSREYKPILIDFGFSRQLPKETHILYDFCGTPNYIAPEVIQREGYYGKPADIWALGVVIHKMITGTFPYKNLTEKNTNLKAMKTELKLPPEVSPELNSLLNQILSYDFRRRPTAEEILSSEWLMGR